VEHLSGLTLFLAGDVMTGRGIDQCLQRSVDPVLYEYYAKSAEQYVQLAERHSGPIPRPLAYRRLWGDAIPELRRRRPGTRIINLETALTTHPDPWPAKGIHYRMHPGNAPLLSAAGIDLCVLANNHTMDWGREGLAETLRTLHKIKMNTTGAGTDTQTAAAPATFRTGSTRLLVFAYATPCSGTPPAWKSGHSLPGMNVLDSLDTSGIGRVIDDIRSRRRPGDRVIVSMHWGGNWGYDIPSAQRTFAHSLLDAGAADIIHGHSSHHPKRIEIYRRRLIIYGCGDLINDYEGIGGHEGYRDDLSVMFFPRINADGTLHSLEATPMKIHRFSLCYPSAQEVEALAERWNREDHLHPWVQFGIPSRWIQDRIPSKDRNRDRRFLRLVLDA
jgi:poly-gamma-glutamate capsule biosynthesis protein CapA/YwtB (metallophosphatase superfamily)